MRKRARQLASPGDVMLACEFLVLRWAPDLVRGEFANIGVLLQEKRRGGRVVLRFARNWRRARAFDDEFDVRLMDQLAAELAQRLSSEEQDRSVRPLLEVMRSSFSNGLVITEPQACYASTLEEKLDELVRRYVEPTRRRGPEKPENAGRGGLLRAMRYGFEESGVWQMMRRGIPAAEYTAEGDALRIDCGYRAETVDGPARMFHAVSLATEMDMAKVLAFSAAQLRAGVMRVDGAALELTALVEAEASVPSAARYRFALSAMQEAEIRVVTPAELAGIAEMARRELRV